MRSRILKIVFWLFAICTPFVLIILVASEEELVATLLSFFYFGMLFIVGIRWVSRQLKTIIKLKNEKSKTELLHLKSQVNPHFFFNTLNNLYGLVEEDSKKAQELILKLSDMMRYSIYEGKKDIVTLEQEITYLQNYIALHKMRYHKIIDVKFNVFIQSKGYKVMPLLFIILLENAFKHGVENLTENPYVVINLANGGNEIHFEVINNFDPSELPKKAGIGLKNLKRRLELVYPKKHSLSFHTTEDVYKAKLTLQNL
ncbi:sensor histidine kinase [Aquimarina sp. M1]